jgi:predicted metalloprotease
MRWEGNEQSENVEDRRGEGGGGRGGGGFIGGRSIGIGTIAVALIAGWIFGINPLTVLSLLSGGGGEQVQVQQQQQGPAPKPPSSDREAAFVSTVLRNTEVVWTNIFRQNGGTYQPPRLVLFRGATPTACGTGQAAMGPFYCPGDKKVYLDTTFFEQLDRQFGASGDFAQAYVIAHEVGHHIQNLTGILPKFNQMRQSMGEAEANAMSMRVELQADCFAGVWGHYTAQKGLLEQGDVEEALNAAQQIGDDTLQKRMQGYVVPESFNHGTSAQRQKWFAAGLQSGKLSSCDTFNNPI